MRQSVTDRPTSAARPPRLRLAALTLAVLLPSAAGYSPPAAAQTARPSCLGEIVAAERRHAIPKQLLVAIALAESGRRDPESGLLAPWPWTVNADGNGRFFETADNALADAGSVLARGQGRVDVGCLQIDLYHHPRAFPTLRQAFDPSANADYAARHLADLHRSRGSWTAAAAAYHSSDPSLGGAYLAKVLHFWRALADDPPPEAAGPRRGFTVDDAPQPLDVAAQLYAARNFQGALAVYRASLGARPDDPAALIGAAASLSGLGRTEDARGFLERALIADPDNRTALDQLLRLIDAEAPERRAAHLASARRLAPNEPGIPARQSAIAAGLGRYAEAIADAEAALRLAPGDPVLLLNHALLLDRGGLRPRAAAAYGAFLAAYRPGTTAIATPLQAIRARYAYLRDHPDTSPESR